jgi:hypothetical protein
MEPDIVAEHEEDTAKECHIMAYQSRIYKPQTFINTKKSNS